MNKSNISPIAPAVRALQRRPTLERFVSCLSEMASARDLESISVALKSSDHVIRSIAAGVTEEESLDQLACLFDHIEPARGQPKESKISRATPGFEEPRLPDLPDDAEDSGRRASKLTKCKEAIVSLATGDFYDQFKAEPPVDSEYRYVPEAYFFHSVFEEERDRFGFHVGQEFTKAVRLLRADAESQPPSETERFNISRSARKSFLEVWEAAVDVLFQHDNPNEQFAQDLNKLDRSADADLDRVRRSHRRWLLKESGAVLLLGPALERSTDGEAGVGSVSREGFGVEARNQAAGEEDFDRLTNWVRGSVERGLLPSEEAVAAAPIELSEALRDTWLDGISTIASTLPAKLLIRHASALPQSIFSALLVSLRGKGRWPRADADDLDEIEQTLSAILSLPVLWPMQLPNETGPQWQSTSAWEAVHADKRLSNDAISSAAARRFNYITPRDLLLPFDWLIGDGSSPPTEEYLSVVGKSLKHLHDFERLNVGQVAFPIGVEVTPQFFAVDADCFDRLPCCVYVGLTAISWQTLNLWGGYLRDRESVYLYLVRSIKSCGQRRLAAITLTYFLVTQTLAACMGLAAGMQERRKGQLFFNWPDICELVDEINNFGWAELMAKALRLCAQYCEDEKYGINDLDKYALLGLLASEPESRASSVRQAALQLIDTGRRTLDELPRRRLDELLDGRLSSLPAETQEHLVDAERQYSIDSVHQATFAKAPAYAVIGFATALEQMLSQKLDKMLKRDDSRSSISAVLGLKRELRGNLTLDESIRLLDTLSDSRLVKEREWLASDGCRLELIGKELIGDLQEFRRLRNKAAHTRISRSEAEQARNIVLTKRLVLRLAATLGLVSRSAS